MTGPLRIFVVAGEASGDALGAGFMAALKALHPDAEFYGVGGRAMQAQGLSPLFPMEELSVMGVFEVLPKLAGLVAHVSIVGDLEPVDGPQALQPRKFGLLVSGNGKGGVLLPGEAATAAWQVATCRKKAGLKPRERARLYRFETAVVGPISLAE